MNIVQIASPNHDTGRNGHTPKWIIVHGTAGGSSAGAIGNYFADATSRVSTHYVIGQDGSIVQCVDERNAAWGNGIIEQGHDPWWSELLNPNKVTISIEHVKPHIDNRDQITDAQKKASFALIAAICDRWGIPKRIADANGGITGHFSIQPINRAYCPGPYPWDELWAHLQKGTTMGVPLK